MRTNQIKPITIAFNISQYKDDIFLIHGNFREIPMYLSHHRDTKRYEETRQTMKVIAQWYKFTQRQASGHLIVDDG